MSNHNNSRALVVEDDRAWQQILTELLGDAGLAVDIAANQATALATMRAASHRLAVVDLSLGGANHHNQEGLQILQALQRHDPACVPVLLTGFATVEIAVSAMKDYGAHTCLRKEIFRRAQFRDLVREILADSTPRPAGEEPATVASIFPPQKPEGRLSGPLPSGRILVIEDDAGWQDIFSELLTDAGHEVEFCRSYGEALGRLKRGSYHAAVVDLSLANTLAPTDNVDGLRLLGACNEVGVETIVVSGIASPAQTERIYNDYNAYAFFEKQAFERTAFIHTLDEALANQLVGTSLDILTEREREVLDLLVQGMTNKQIAQDLVISPNTVKRHLKAIFAKLEVVNRAAAVAKAVGRGF